ncbi:hypothetical protein Tco_1322652 [Tanacetum coccineum]
MVVGELRMIDMDELVRLHICERLGDTWVWVAPGPERQQVAPARALEDIKGAHAERMARLDEKVHGVRESLNEQREVVDTMARDFSRFTMWAASVISRLLDFSGAIYTRYYETHFPYQRRRARQRTDGASTTAA